MEKDVFCGRYVRLSVEEKLGHNYERVYIRDSVLVIIVTSDNKLRFVREYDWHRDLIKPKLVSGYIEQRENPIACARRELKEELGIVADSWEDFSVSRKKGVVNMSQYFFVARDISEGDFSPGDDEFIEGYVDLSFSEVKKKTKRGEFGKTATAFTLLTFIDEHG